MAPRIVAAVKAVNGPAPAAVQQQVEVTLFGVPTSAQTGTLLVTLHGTDPGQTISCLNVLEFLSAPAPSQGF